MLFWNELKYLKIVHHHTFDWFKGYTLLYNFSNNELQIEISANEFRYMYAKLI